MWFFILCAVIGVLTLIGFKLGERLSRHQARRQPLQASPVHYGIFVALWCGLPALLALVAWQALSRGVIADLALAGLPQETLSSLGADVTTRSDLLLVHILNAASGALDTVASPAILEAAARYQRLLHYKVVVQALVTIAILLVCGTIALYRVTPRLRAREAVEGVVKALLAVCSATAVLTSLGIVLSLLFESVRFFSMVAPLDFLCGLEWSPQTALRADQVGSSGAFGAVPLFAGTVLISLIAMLVATPIGLFAAIYMSEYAPRTIRTALKPTLEMLAGIPTVVYGFFAALTAAPFFRKLGVIFGLDVSSESALAAGVVMGIMIIPFVSSLSEDVLSAVPQSLRESSYGLGATQSETIVRVVLPAALPGIAGALLLAVSRAIGETMIVLMGAGLAANLTANPFEAVTTVTVQIVTMLVGDNEFNSAKTLSAFALGLVLFVATLILNSIAFYVVRKHRQEY